MTGWARLPTLSLRLRIALTILCLEAVLVGGVLFVTLHHSLNTTKIELAAADRDTTALLHDLGRIALLTDEFGAVQSFIEQLGQASRISAVTVIDLSGRIMASSDAATIGTRSEPVARSGRPNSTSSRRSVPAATGWAGCMFTFPMTAWSRPMAAPHGWA